MRLFMYLLLLLYLPCFYTYSPSSPIPVPASISEAPTKLLVKSLLDRLNVRDAEALRMLDMSKLRKDICDLELLALKEDCPSFPALWSLLEGEWRLLYSNNAGPSRFSSSSFGNNRFGLHKVTQRFKRNQEYQGESSYICENVLYIKSLLYSGEVILSHSAYAVSNSQPASMAIELDTVETSIPLPNILVDYRNTLSPSYLRKGIFDTTFCDDELRISRGANGEMRLFMKEM